jgi:hypothetical protein
MSLGPDTSIINGQRVALFQNDAFAPTSFFPVAPVGVAQTYPMGAPVVGGGQSSTGSDSMQVHQATNAPFSFTHSPLPWAITFLVIGLVGLRIVHWRFLDKEL